MRHGRVIRVEMMLMKEGRKDNGLYIDEDEVLVLVVVWATG